MYLTPNLEEQKKSPAKDKVKAKGLRRDSESEVEPNYDFNIDINLKNVFERETKAMTEIQAKVGVDRSMIFLSGPITTYCESPLSIPTDKIPESSKVAVTKIA